MTARQRRAVRDLRARNRQLHVQLRKERRELRDIIQGLWKTQLKDRSVARHREHALQVELTQLRRLNDRLPRTPVHSLCVERCQFAWQQRTNHKLRESLDEARRELKDLARHDADDGQEILRLRRQLAKLTRPPADAAVVAMTVTTEGAPPQPQPGNGEPP
jgi:hypothetical protein